MRWLLIFCAVSCAADAYQFRFDYQYNEEIDGWLKLQQIPERFYPARLTCLREGAVVASPENDQLKKAMMKTMGKLDKIYTGIHAKFSESYFYSQGGTPLSRMGLEWFPCEPQMNFGEDGIYMTSNGTIGTVNDTEKHPYICYRKRSPDLHLTNCGTFDKGYVIDNRTGKCYKFHPEPQEWKVAFATCSGEGGHLAIVNSNTELQVLKDLINKNPPNSMPGTYDKQAFHMGFIYWSTYAQWRTIYGQTLREAGYETWAPDMPNTPGGIQHCGGINRSGLLVTLHCGGYAFICEKEPNSLL